MADEKNTESKPPKSTGQMAKDVAKALFLHGPEAFGKAMYHDPLASPMRLSPEAEGMAESAMGELVGGAPVAGWTFLRDMFVAGRDRDPGFALAAAFGLITPFSAKQARAAGAQLRKFITGKNLGPNPDAREFKEALDEFVETEPEATQAILAAGDDFAVTNPRGIEIPEDAQPGAREYLPGGDPFGAEQNPKSLRYLLSERKRAENYEGPFTRPLDPEPYAAFDAPPPQRPIYKPEVARAAMDSSTFMEDNPDFASYLQSSDYAEGIPYGGRPVDMDVEDMADSRLMDPFDRADEAAWRGGGEEALDRRRVQEVLDRSLTVDRDPFPDFSGVPEELHHVGDLYKYGDLPPTNNRMDGLGAGPRPKTKK